MGISLRDTSGAGPPKFGDKHDDYYGGKARKLKITEVLSTQNSISMFLRLYLFVSVSDKLFLCF